MSDPTSLPIDRELETRLSNWKGRVVPELEPVLERHALNLIALLRSLEAAGRSPSAIRSCLRDLLVTYEADLIAALAPVRSE